MNDDSGAGIGNLNPFRYRGYFYDEETGWYYLKSRYYDPEVGRFINADEILNSSNLRGYNVYSYCLNDPINFEDSKGMVPQSCGPMKLASYYVSKKKSAHEWICGYTDSIYKTNPIMEDKKLTWGVSEVTVGAEQSILLSQFGDSSRPITFYTERDIANLAEAVTIGGRIQIEGIEYDLFVGTDVIGHSISLSDDHMGGSISVHYDTSVHKLGYTMALSVNDDIVSNKIYVTYSIDMKQVGQSILVALGAIVALGSMYGFVTTGQIAPQLEYVLRR